MQEDFVITQAGWHTQTVRNYEFDNSLVYAVFTNFIYYLQRRNLTSRVLLKDGDKADDNTCIRVSDLTELGFDLYKKIFTKWFEKILSKKILPSDYKVLDKALQALIKEK